MEDDILSRGGQKREGRLCRCGRCGIVGKFNGSNFYPIPFEAPFVSRWKPWAIGQQVDTLESILVCVFCYEDDLFKIGMYIPDAIKIDAKSFMIT
jgi:hypothetical protein